MKLKMLDLFSGIGGMSLAAEWTGQIETVAFCEIAEYPQKVLRKHWPDVPIFQDIKTLTKQSLIEMGVIDDGVRGIDIVSGGFPCQPFSCAGKRRGKEDDRYLWPEMLRVIQEVHPIWIVGENVANLVNLGIEICLSDMENIGYLGGVLQIPACSVGARHRRERVFIVAYSNSKRWDSLEKDKQNRLSEINIQASFQRFDDKTHIPIDIHGLLSKPSSGVLRNDDGLPEALDRLKCLGNAVVPQQVYPIFKAIAEITQLRS